MVTGMQQFTALSPRPQSDNTSLLVRAMIYQHWPRCDANITLNSYEMVLFMCTPCFKSAYNYQTTTDSL